MHQVNVGGGYRFSPTTRLSVAGSWARLTQNENFIDSAGGLRRGCYRTRSAHAKVLNTFLSAHVSPRGRLKDLSVNAAYRYDDRDNKTPILDLPDDRRRTRPARPTQFTNEPISRRVHQLTLDAEYSLGRGPGAEGRVRAAGYPPHRDGRGVAVPADTTYEDTFRIEYRRTLDDSLTGRLVLRALEAARLGIRAGRSAPDQPAGAAARGRPGAHGLRAVLPRRPPARQGAQPAQLPGDATR